jgi:hypothetical protein
MTLGNQAGDNIDKGINWTAPQQGIYGDSSKTHWFFPVFLASHD